MTFTLAHISDLHLGPLPTPRPAELMSKRFIGYLSWHLRRKRLHDPEVLALLAQDLATVAPDHVAITGDLANISLPGEFDRAREWLARAGGSDWISLVPGNHDAYVPVDWNRSIGLWSDYFTSEVIDPAAFPTSSDDPFPFVRQRGPVAVIGVNTACPTPIGFASGRVGTDQLDRLETYLQRFAESDLFRIVLLHHPPQEGAAPRRKQLEDAASFRSVIARAGAELILHGHNHKFAQAQIAGPASEVPVFGVPSASAAKAGKKPQSHYQLYAIERDQAGWRVEVTVRGFDPTSRSYSETRTHSLQIRARHG